MNITWVTRSFLDYRIPVYKALDELCGGKLTIIYSDEVNPQRVKDKLKLVLGDRAVGLTGEVRLSGKKSDNATMANKGLRIPYQPGLIGRIRESRPDVLLSDGFFQWTYAPLLVRALKGIPHVMCYERTPHTERNAGRLRTFYRRFVSRWIDGIDCNGSLTAEYVTNTLGYGKPLAFGHMTADTAGVAERVSKVSKEQTDQLRSKYKLNGLTFVYMGQLIPRKGIMEMLESWRRAALKDATLLLVGDGAQKNEVSDYISRHGMADVIPVGAVDYDSLGPYYKVADCFIIPTLEDNWSLVVPEAMAAGLPVACSIYNGCYPELVRASNGWTFDPLDTGDTVRVLNEISASRAKLEDMGAESQRIISGYTPQHAAQGIYDICLKVVGNE